MSTLRTFLGTFLGTFLAIACMACLLAPLAMAWFPSPTSKLVVAEAAPISWVMLAASVGVGAVAATLAVAIGAAAAGLLTLARLPAAGVWATLMLASFACPPTVWALGQLYCFGAGGLLEQWFGDGLRPMLSRVNAGGYFSVVFVLAQIYAPLAMLLVGRGFQRVSAAGFESAVLSLSRGALVRWLLGAARLELAAAWLLTFALGLTNFAVPHVLQCNLYPIDIYLRATNYLDPTGALRTAAPLLLLAIAASVSFALLDHHGGWSSARPQRAARVSLGTAGCTLAGLLAVYLGACYLLPLAAILWQCESPGFFLKALREAAPETENTLLIAGGAACVATFAGLAVGTWRPRRGVMLRDALALAPLGVPALFIGLAYARFFNRSWPIDLAWVGDGGLLVTLGLAVRSWPFATRIIAAGHRRLSPTWREAAELGGLRTLERWRWISGPLLAGNVASGALVAFVLAMGSVEIGQMLCAPGYGTLSLRLFTSLHLGPAHETASLAMWQLTLALTPVAVYYLLTNRNLPMI